jgi:hypothetical protein
MSRCQHGHPICQSWQECPECRAEDDAYQASYAAQESLEEHRKQTTLLEEIKRNQEEILKRKS